MLERFKRYLIQQGYCEYTPSGNPSTVYDYVKRIKRVCKREGVSIEKLSDKIGFYVKKYDTLGSEAKYGKSSHNAVI